VTCPGAGSWGDWDQLDPVVQCRGCDREFAPAELNPDESIPDHEPPAGDWAMRLVEWSAFMHVDASAGRCRGYTMSSSGRAICGFCRWELSGRMEDAGEERSARFALYVLASIGLVVGVAAMEHR
jgi:hypothetical protein